VFVIGKDFVSAVPLRAGIAGGMTAELFDQPGERGAGHSSSARTIRPFALQGTSGIIPKVKINYFEVATLAGGIATKDEARTEIEQIFTNYSAQARQGIPVEAHIPHVGKLHIKNSLAGIVFDSELIQASRGQTAKGYEYLFAGNNWMNSKIYEPNKADFGEQAEDLLSIAPYSPASGVRVSRDARRWLKKNLDLEFDGFKGQRSAVASPQHLQTPTPGGPWSRRSDRKAPSSRYGADAAVEAAGPGQPQGPASIAAESSPAAELKAQQRSRALSAYSEVRSYRSG